MRILTIDPGHTVGYAAQDDRGETVMAGSIPSDIFKAIFETMLEIFKPDVVVFERMPHSNHDSVTSNLYYNLAGNCIMLNIAHNSVLPGHWKPVTPAKVENPVGTHTSDALRMLHYVTRVNTDYVSEAILGLTKKES